MKSKKYSLLFAIASCFRYAPGATLVKLLLEIINGVLMPLMVLVVAAFINNAVLYAGGEIKLASVIAPLVLMAAYYTYSQGRVIVIRLADKTLSNALKENVRPQLVQKHMRISYELLENPDILDLISRVCDSCERTILAILNTGLLLIRVGIQAWGTLYLLATYAWWIGILFISCTVPIVLIARRGGKAIYASDVITTKLTRRHYYLSSVLTGREAAAERTLFGYTDDINEKFAEAHLKRSNLVTRKIAVEEIAINACGLILNGLVLVAIFALLQSVRENVISQGLFVSLVGSLIALARIITGTVSRLISSGIGYLAYMKDYAKFFSLPEIEVKSNAEPMKERAVFTSLKICNLRFRYTPEGPYVLNGVNLTIEKGKSYSLIGQNGAGKSTLTKILLGLYREFEGQILINDTDIAEYSTEQLCRIFSIVYQDFARYYIPLADNITLGKEQGDLNASIQLAALEDVIAKLPQKEHTALGKVLENGVDLSGGEWQKVAIARALYANTPFMILDEPTASLSPMAESSLYKRFAEITSDKTSLLISHRLGSTKLADMLFVLDSGVVAEIGTHDQLMATNGIYAEMFKRQRSWYDESL